MNNQIELTNQIEQPVLSIRIRTNVGNLPVELGKAYNDIILYLGAMGEKAAGAAFAAYYNMDMEDLDVEMGFPVSKPIAGNGTIKANSIPAGKQLSCMHKGPYDQAGPVYESMTGWMNENGQISTGVCYEFYYNSPMDVPENELLTKVVFLLK